MKKHLRPHPPTYVPWVVYSETRTVEHRRGHEPLTLKVLYFSDGTVRWRE